MSLSTTDSIKEAFHRAVRENLQLSLLTGEDWDRFKDIQRETDARLMTEQATYARDYTARIADAKEIILREENGVRLDEPLPSWAERHSDADALQRKADARVSRDHQQRCAAIKSDELNKFQDLKSEIRMRDTPTRSFNRSTTRDRSGPQRNQ